MSCRPCLVRSGRGHAFQAPAHLIPQLHRLQDDDVGRVADDLTGEEPQLAVSDRVDLRSLARSLTPREPTASALLAIRAGKADAVGSRGVSDRASERRSRFSGTVKAPGREAFLGRSWMRESLNIRGASRPISRPMTYQRPRAEVMPHGSNVRRAPSR